MKQRTRIQCIKARTYPNYIRRDRMRRAIEGALMTWRRMSQAMREACAKVCESRFMGDMTREDMEARRCAAAIRARREMP